MSTLPVAAIFTPLLPLAAVMVFVVLLILARRRGTPSLSSTFLALGVLLGAVAVLGAENTLDDEVVLPLSILKRCG